MHYEPVTGEVMRIENRFQLNFEVGRSILFPNLRKEKMLLPMLWIDRGKTIDAGNAFEFQSSVLVWKGVAVLCSGLGIGFGLLAILTGVVLWIIGLKDQKQRLAHQKILAAGAATRKLEYKR